MEYIFNTHYQRIKQNTTPNLQRKLNSRKQTMRSEHPISNCQSQQSNKNYQDRN